MSKNSDQSQRSPTGRRPGDSENGNGAARPVQPHWDATLRHRTLFLGDEPEKVFLKLAVDQWVVLDEFERQGWIHVMDDPLPFRRSRNAVKRLRDTVHSLNRLLISGRIRFYTANRGRAIRWELAA